MMFAALESPPMVELPPEEVIFVRSSTMNPIQRSLRKAANASVPLLLQGESYTGKEILTRFVHRHSPWGNGAFVKVSCPTIPGTVLESALFGYGKGASADTQGTKPTWRGPLCGDVDESIRNLVRPDRVF